jgi:hypothetical protein
MQPKKLKAKPEANRITSATTATAKAINKAVSQINKDNAITQINHLRISNLENSYYTKNRHRRIYLNTSNPTNNKNKIILHHNVIPSP